MTRKMTTVRTTVSTSSNRQPAARLTGGGGRRGGGGGGTGWRRVGKSGAPWGFGPPATPIARLARLRVPAQLRPELFPCQRSALEMQIASAIVWIIPAAGLAAVLFPAWLARDVLRRDTGTEAMQEVAGTIFEGAVAFIRRQYLTIAGLALLAAVLIGLFIGAFETAAIADTNVFGPELGLRTAVAFLVGSAASMLSGVIGMYISVRSNVRTAAAARRSLVEAVTVAFRGGAVSGFLVVALSLLGVWGIFALYGGFDPGGVRDAPFLIVGFGFGASFVALFAHLGGGVFTKAADVGSDLVGKIEAGIPE